MGWTKESSNQDPKQPATVGAEILKETGEIYSTILKKEGEFDAFWDIAGSRPARKVGLWLQTETLLVTERLYLREAVLN